MQPVTTRFLVVLSAATALVIIGVLVLMLNHYAGSLTETTQQIETRMVRLER